MLHGKVVGKHCRGLPGQGKEQREDSEVLKTPRSGWSREGLREKRLETGMEKSPGWMAKELSALGRGLDFALKTVETNSGIKPGKAGSDLHFRNRTDGVMI